MNVTIPADLAAKYKNARALFEDLNEKAESTRQTAMQMHQPAADPYWKSHREITAQRADVLRERDRYAAQILDVVAGVPAKP